jgi:hypothetical protein
MAAKRPPGRQTVKRMREREASTGLEADDAAAQWLAENDAPPPPKTPKSASKNKVLHQWRKRTKDSQAP